MSSIIRSRRREAAAPHRGRSLRRHAAASALAALVGLWPSAAGAEVLLFSANTNQMQIFRGTAGFVDLNGTTAGGTTLTFATTQANQRVIITFNASCQVSLTEALSAYAQVAILVDPAGPGAEFSAPPTNTTQTAPFCSRGDGVAAAIVASARPSVAGTHGVRVRVTPRGPDPSVVGVILTAMSLAVTR
jgi:hypothetical protein